MAKYINIPFAESGNKTAIPDTTTDGTVNYTDGFGGDYSRPLGTDPLAKTVDRETINQALYDYGTAIQQLQENGFFAWQSTKAGGYDIGAAVSLNGVNYENTVAANTATPPNNGWRALDIVVGSVIAYASSTVPIGFLECNGATISRTTYSSLYAIIGTTYGVGDGSTTFNIPDLRGEFIRGFDNGRGIDSGRTIGTSQLDSLQGHKHYVAGAVDDGSPDIGSTTYNGSNVFRGDDARDYDRVVGNPVDDGVNGVPRVSPETRPRNIAMMYCIKY